MYALFTAIAMVFALQTSLAAESFLVEGELTTYVTNGISYPVIVLANGDYYEITSDSILSQTECFSGEYEIIKAVQDPDDQTYELLNIYSCQAE